jgi:HSP20 family protein
MPATVANNRPAFPQINMWSKDDKVTLVAELPGVAANKLDLQVQDDILTLQGNKENGLSGEEATYHRRERLNGNFKRSLKLPFRVNANKISAEFKKGLLIIHMERAEEDKPKKIEIKSN